VSGENFDISSGEEPRRRAQPGTLRKYLGIHFACCGVYSRIYVNREQSAYVGNCPRCTRQVRIGIGPGGSNARFFTAY